MRSFMLCDHRSSGVFPGYPRLDSNLMEKDLARPSHFEGFTGAKPLRMSEGYPRVFTTEKGVGRLISG